MPNSLRKPEVGTYGLLLLAALIETTLIWMRTLSDLRQYVVETIAILLATSIFYILSVWLLLKRSQSGSARPLLFVTLISALVFRLTVSAVYPAFTDDLYRYRWEGMLQAHGYNPYTTAPDSPAAGRLRDNTYPSISNRELSAVYGPLIQLEQRLAYRLASDVTPDPVRQILWFKLLPALADLGVIAAVCLMLRNRNMPVQRVLVYAWCPLPIFEFWATGHNDSILVLFVTLAAAIARRRTLSYVCLSLAALTKFWPVLLLPSFTGLNWRRIFHAAAVLVPVAAVLFLPYWADLESNARLTSGFLGGWRNNDSLHGLIAVLTPDPYTAKYVTATLIVLAALAMPFLPWSLEARTLALIVSILALSANVHPWYLTWMIPFLAIYPLRSLLLWVALVPVTYSVLIDWTILHEWNGLTWWRWLVYVPVGIYLAVEGGRISR